ncbi:MAG TPA: IS1595 family transposase [Terriglobales bacterium]|nr:IS1595 family transposase [Terriglobales bacterium]
MKPEPKSLQEAIIYFADPDNCINYLAVRRWPKGVVCPTCGSDSVKFNASRRIWQCASHHAKRQFSIKVGTIFEDSAIGLDKWLTATWMLTNCKNGISSYEIARDVKVTQKTAWFMMHRIRLAVQDESFGKLGGDGKHIEVDETFIGAKARNIHKNKRTHKLGMANKAMVLGVLERGGNIRARVAKDRSASAVCDIVREHVVPETKVFTDKLLSYKELEGDYVREVIDHAEGYVRGQVHTNGLENFWSLLKRGLHGTYVSVEPFHLFRYLDEQVFRFNHRATKKNKVTDADRFNLAISKIVGKRLTFAQLTGKLAETAAF